MGQTGQKKNCLPTVQRRAGNSLVTYDSLVTGFLKPVLVELDDLGLLARHFVEQFQLLLDLLIFRRELALPKRFQLPVEVKDL